MNSFAAFLKLIRWPNLVFIIITQFLFWNFVLPFIYSGSTVGPEALKLSGELFLVLVLASVCIAAAGYIVNDHFDVLIDQVNKPGKVIIGVFIKPKTATLLYVGFSTLGLALSFYVGYELNNYYIPAFNFLSILILWFYSTTFKKKLLIGNILVSLLTAWVILVLTLAEYRFNLSAGDVVWQRILKISFVYGGFAFIVSLVRETIKDMEDVEGDARFGCTTMPIVWGIRAAKTYTSVLLVVLVGLILAIVIYILQFGWWIISIYAVLNLVLPIVWVLFKLYSANSPPEFHRLSSVVKGIMLAGILSMLFFYIPR